MAEINTKQSQNSFCVKDWHERDQALTVYMLDASGSTGDSFMVNETSARQSHSMVLDFEKELLMRTMTKLESKSKQLLIIVRDRCPICGATKVFCECKDFQGYTHCVEFGGVDSVKTQIAAIQPLGGTFLAKPISALPMLLSKHLYPEQARLLLELEEQITATRFLLPPLDRIVVQYLGQVPLNVRIIAAVDGLNNIGCGACEACIHEAKNPSFYTSNCRYGGTDGVVVACKDLLEDTSWLRMHIELNVVIADTDQRLTNKDSPFAITMKALCSATGGVCQGVRTAKEAKNAIKTISGDFISETLDRKVHVNKRRAQVSNYQHGSYKVNIHTTFDRGDLDIVMVRGRPLRGNVETRSGVVKRSEVKYHGLMPSDDEEDEDEESAADSEESDEENAADGESGDDEEEEVGPKRHNLKQGGGELKKQRIV